MSNPKLTHLDAPLFEARRGLFTSFARALGVDGESGQTLTLSLQIGLTDGDELYAAALAAALRRELPEVVERIAAEAYDRVFPGALTHREVAV